jgi:hypothetical protein
LSCNGRGPIRQVPSSSVKFQGQPSQNAAHSFFSSNPSPHLIGRTGDTAVREAQMPSTAPSQHVAICSLTRRVLRCASEVISMQSARSSACNQLDAARLALHERGHPPAISFHRWQSACILRCTSERDSQELSTLSGASSMKHPESQSVAISRNQYEASTESQSVALSGPSHLHERERFPVIEHRVDLTQGAVRRLEMRRDVPVGKGAGAVMSTCMLWRGSGRFVASRCDGMYQ